MPNQNERLQQNWQQLKSEGGTRSQRIGQILKAAFTEMATELKTGATTMKPVAQDLATDVADQLKERGQAAATTINEAWTDQADNPDLVKRLQVMLQRLASAVKARLWPQVQREMADIDAALANSYGDRYQATKQRLNRAKGWYQSQQQQKQTGQPPVPPRSIAIEPEQVVTVDVVVHDQSAMGA